MTIPLLKRKLFWIILGGVVVLGGITYAVVARPKTNTEQTLTVHATNFLQQVSVSGKVTATQKVDLGFSQGGRVARVSVSVGQTVRAGTVIAEIENGDLRAAILQKQAALQAQQAKLQTLEQGTRPEEIAIAQSNVVGATNALSQANQTVLNAITDAFASADDSIHNKADKTFTNGRTTTPRLTFLTASSQRVINLELQRVAIESMLTTWQKDIANLEASDSAIAAAITAQTNLAMVSAFLAEMNIALNQALPSQTVSDAMIATYVTDMASARTKINASIATLNAAVTAQKSATANLDNAQKTLSLKKGGSVPTDITAGLAQVNVARADVENALAQLTKTRIVAPFDGVVTRMDAKVGQISGATTPEISLIGTGAFQIESFVPEINVALIHVGDKASVTLDAYGDETLFEAIIVSIDPAETLQNGVSTYRTILQFSKPDTRIKSGMTANVVITTQSRTNVLTVPQGIITERDGKKFVMVKINETSQEREVTTGAISSMGQIEIISGLRDNDVVIIPAAK